MGYELEAEELEAGFDVEMDESDDADSTVEMEALVERVKAARYCGA